MARLWEAHGERIEAWHGDPAQVAYAALIDTLGRRTAGVHAALMQPSGDPAFEPEAVHGHDIGTWQTRLRVEVEETLAQLARALERADGLRGEARALADRLLARRTDLEARVREGFPAIWMR